jgi:hypothetical protein
MIALACVDGGLICGPILVALLGGGGLWAWLRCRSGCDHEH